MPAREPKELDALLAAALAAGDAEAAGALYEDDAVLFPMPGQPVSGPAVREAIGQFAALKANLRMDVVRVIEAAGVAIVFNDWEGQGTAPDGSTVPLAGKALEVVRRQPDGTWKYLIDDPYARS